MMNRQDRAKQFAPFDALNGLREALAKKEYNLGKVERGEHSEELDSEISDKLSKVQRGDRIALTCYQDGYYVKVIGAVKEINTIFKYIVIGNGKVYFDDIYGIDRDLVYTKTDGVYVATLTIMGGTVYTLTTYDEENDRLLCEIRDKEGEGYTTYYTLILTRVNG